MYRLTVETLLGLQLEKDRLRIAPCIPDHWGSYKIHYRYRETFYHITVKRVDEQPKHLIRVAMDGVALEGAGGEGAGCPYGMIPLVDDRREHQVEVMLS